MIKKDLYELGKTWNSFVRKLQGAERLWEEFQEKLGEVPRDGLEDAPMQLQKAAARMRRTSFEVMLPRFVDFWRGYGKLEGMIIPLDELRGKEEKKDD